MGKIWLECLECWNTIIAKWVTVACGLLLREELLQSLAIVQHCLLGAGSMLPPLDGLHVADLWALRRHTHVDLKHFMQACHVFFAPCILCLFSVPSMVNLGEIKLHIGVDYGKTRTGSHETHAQAVALSPVSEGAHSAFSVHTGRLCVSPPLQMIHGRTTESPSAKPWDCCYVSEDSNSTTL